MPAGAGVSRIVGAGLATIAKRKIRIFFQRFPGTNARSGIQGLDFTVTVVGGLSFTGTTPADGKVEIVLGAGETATLDILGSQYQIALLTGGLHPVTQLRGVQQRLNILGYNAGSLQGDNTAAVTPPPVVENQSTLETELAILNFQADNDPLFSDAICGTKTQTRIRNNVRNSGGE